MGYLPAITDSDLLDGLSVRYLKVFGLWKTINDYRTSGKRNAIIKFQVVLTLLLSAPSVLCQCLCYFMIKIDIQKVTFLSLNFMPIIQICTKILVFWFRLNSLCKLYNLMRKDFLTIPEFKRADTKMIFMKIGKANNIVTSACLIVNKIGVLVLAVVPTTPIEYLTHGTGSLAAGSGVKKIWGLWYPVPMAESPYYEVIYVYEAILLSWGGILLAVQTCLFYQLLMCLYAQFTVLGYHVSTLKFDSKVIGKSGSDNYVHNCHTAMYKELYSILRDHQKLLSYADELKRVYNPLITLVLGLGIVVLTTAIFQFVYGGEHDVLLVYKNVTFLAYQGIEVSIFCYGSSSIEKASSDLLFAIYSSDWYKADVRFRKAAQMVMLRARKGVTLTAIRMYPVNMETMMSIFQFTYSVAMLMSRMAE